MKLTELTSRNFHYDKFHAVFEDVPDVSPHQLWYIYFFLYFDFYLGFWSRSTHGFDQGSSPPGVVEAGLVGYVKPTSDRSSVKIGHSVDEIWKSTIAVKSSNFKPLWYYYVIILLPKQHETTCIYDIHSSSSSSFRNNINKANCIVCNRDILISNNINNNHHTIGLYICMYIHINDAINYI